MSRVPYLASTSKAVLMSLTMGIGVLLHTPAMAAKPCTLASLQWLLGEWQSSGDEQDITESWQKVSEDTFEGIGITRTKNSTSVESMRLVHMLSDIYFIAKVAHNPLPVAFKLTTCESQRAVFSNQQHDFPNRLDYRLLDHQRLQVSVQDNQQKGFEITFSRR